MDPEFLKQYARFLAVGLEVAVLTALGFWVGRYFGAKFNLGFAFSTGGSLLGMALGFLRIWRFLKRGASNGDNKES